MRATTRLLAIAKAPRHLEAGGPTGLTGLLTHSAPRSTLMHTYNMTLEKLKRFPESSVYRQSVENLTKHRLTIIEKAKPEGLEEWQARVKETVEAHPEAFRIIGSQTNAKEVNFVFREDIARGMDNEEFNDEPVSKPELEGPRSVTERKGQGEAFSRDLRVENLKLPRIEPEPPLTIEQINEIEQAIGAGLIEEVIQVAEGERLLVDRMYESKVWEDLEVKPTEGQWAYYERDRHTGVTQAR